MNTTITTNMTVRMMAALLAAVLFTAACSQTGEREAGIEVETVAANRKSTAAPAPASATGEGGSSGEAVAKHDHDATTQSFTRDDGRRIDLQKGFVNLFPVGLEPCAMAAFKPLDALLATAQAHGGGDGPDASIVDVSQADGTLWPLGALSAAPGRYCGLRVALVPVSAAGAAPDEVDMSGSSLYVAPCFFHDPGDPAAHYCFTLAVPGGSEERVLPFAAPLQLDRDHRRVGLTVAVVYDRWFDGLDLDGYPAQGTAAEKAAFRAGLQADGALLRQLLANVLAGLQVSVEPAP